MSKAIINGIEYLVINGRYFRITKRKKKSAKAQAATAASADTRRKLDMGRDFYLALNGINAEKTPGQ